jgi:uncharacterized protein YdhG (YjbR/CyaY superfamily)
MVRRHPGTIDRYLKGVSADKRAALQKLRRAIRAAAPKAEECIAYDVPSFRLEGRFLCSFGAATKHCAFYPGSRAIEQNRAELSGYSLSKGTIRFQPESPLPPALVRKLVKARIGAVRRG